MYIYRCTVSLYRKKKEFILVIKTQTDMRSAKTDILTIAHRTRTCKVWHLL